MTMRGGIGVQRFGVLVILSLLLSAGFAGTAWGVEYRYVHVDRAQIGCAGKFGPQPLGFRVYLSTPSTGVVTVDFATEDGYFSSPDISPGTAPTDYTATNGTLVFNPGETAKTVYVTVFCPPYASLVQFILRISNATGDAYISTASGFGDIHAKRVPVVTPCPQCGGH